MYENGESNPAAHDHHGGVEHGVGDGGDVAVGEQVGLTLQVPASMRVGGRVTVWRTGSTMRLW
jgi:hypothetical protein